MFADLMNFDNLRRNILEFVAIIEMNFATVGQAVLDKSSLLISLERGHTRRNETLTLPLTLSRDGRPCSLWEH